MVASSSSSSSSSSHISLCHSFNPPFFYYLDGLIIYSLEVGLCESSFVLLEYSVEYLIGYSSTRWISEVAINHSVVQIKRTPGSSLKFVII